MRGKCEARGEKKKKRRKPVARRTVSRVIYERYTEARGVARRECEVTGEQTALRGNRPSSYARRRPSGIEICRGARASAHRPGASPCCFTAAGVSSPEVRS